MSQPFVLALLVGALLTLCGFVVTSLQYRSLPNNVNLNPLLEPNGMILPRPAVFLVPCVQAGFLALSYVAATGTTPSRSNRSVVEAALILDGALLLLFLIQLWFIKRTANRRSG